jgi:hypothetical protein
VSFPPFPSLLHPGQIPFVSAKYANEISVDSEVLSSNYLINTGSKVCHSVPKCATCASRHSRQTQPPPASGSYLLVHFNIPETEHT